MAVFRIEKTRDYTVMSNYHLRDRSLSLKAKGLLSLMLSLPEDWDYTMKGLARICKDGIDSISGGIRELEAHGYLVRARVRNENGQLGSIEYTILEQPKEPAQTPAPIREKPIRENPIQVKPMLDAPIQENPAQLNTKEQNKELSITQGSSPILSSPPTPREKGRIGQDRMRERESYREIILENIDYDILTSVRQTPSFQLPGDGCQRQQVIGVVRHLFPLYRLAARPAHVPFPLVLQHILPGVGFVVVCREARGEHTVGGFDGRIAVVDPDDRFFVRLHRSFRTGPGGSLSFPAGNIVRGRGKTQYAPVPRGACSAPHTRKRVHFPLGLCGLNFLPGSGPGLVLSI